MKNKFLKYLFLVLISLFSQNSFGKELSINALSVELDKQPDLVRTMSVKPPRITGKIRLVKIGDIDLQPCGGTHVKNTNEIGRITIQKIENKGKKNRRINIILN